MPTASNAPIKRTPLYDIHRRLGARMVTFSGWEMPVSYRGIIEEHQCVRSRAGLFDVSHMGEFEIIGPQAEAAVQYLTSNDVRQLAPNQLQYTVMCNEEGGIIDDLTVCRLAADHFLLVVNAGNIEQDFAWVRAHLTAGAEARNVSDEKALLALQGPAAESVLQPLTPDDLSRLEYYWALPTALNGHAVLLSRTGYTGEDGFEIMTDAAQAPDLWQMLMTAGQPAGLLPAGLGARDTLRLEARYLLYGADMDTTTTPFEVGLGWTVKLDKGDFIGRDALKHLKEQGPQRRLIGFIMQERGIPRAHYPVLYHEQRIGEVTSGTLSPTLGQAIGTAMVQQAYTKIGTEFTINIRQNMIKAQVVRSPFVPRRVKR